MHSGNQELPINLRAAHQENFYIQRCSCSLSILEPYKSRKLQDDDLTMHRYILD